MRNKTGKPNSKPDALPQCPFLGLAWDETTRFGFPNSANYCFKPKQKQPVLLAYQEQACLIEGYLKCPVYTSEWNKKLPEGILGKALPERRNFSLKMGVGLLVILLIIGGFVIAGIRRLPAAEAAGTRAQTSSSQAAGKLAAKSAQPPTVNPASTTTLVYPEILIGMTPPTVTKTIEASGPPAVDSNLVIPTGLAQSCIPLLTPPDGFIFGITGRINFTWQELTGASAYRLVITWPSGEITNFEAAKAPVIRYLESIPKAGKYMWIVIGLDSKGKEICRSFPFSFSK